MGNGAPSGAKIDRQIEAAPIVVDGRRIQPVARLVGWEMDGEKQAGSFVSRMGRLTPLEVRIDSVENDDVENGHEEQETIVIDDPLQEPLRGILIVGALVSIVCISIMLVAQVATRRK